MYNPATIRKLKILGVVADRCAIPGKVAAARQLHLDDVSCADFLETMRLCPTVPSDIVLGIRNEMDALERGIRVDHAKFSYAYARRKLREACAT